MVKVVREQGVWYVKHPQATVETRSIEHMVQIVSFLLSKRVLVRARAA